MDPVNRVQVLDEAVSISLSTNSLGKGKNPPTLPAAMGKIVGRIRLFNLSVAADQGEGNSIKLHLKI